MPTPTQVEILRPERSTADSRDALTIDTSNTAINTWPTSTIKAAGKPDRSTVTIATRIPPSSPSIGQGGFLSHLVSSIATATPARLAARIQA